MSGKMQRVVLDPEVVEVLRRIDRCLNELEKRLGKQRDSRKRRGVRG